MKNEITADNAPLGTEVYLLHEGKHWPAILLERDRPTHRVVVRSDFGEHYFPIGNVQVATTR